LKDVIHTPRPAAPVATAPVAADCLGRTCLKWSADGELTSIDLLLVLERLAQVDQQVSGLCLNSLDSQPCASINQRF
jgi:hypothetical protein